MNYKKYRYIFKVQYLGFRYSGWQKQPGQKTIEGMLVRTLRYILPQAAIKILGAGRTDAKVSAESAAFELFTDTDLDTVPEFLQLFNVNLPSDIRILSCSAVDETFNIIKDIEQKEYHYYFSYGDKNHPFCAPFMADIPGELDIERMKRAAPLYSGTHNFRSYTVKQKKNSKFVRCISSCIIERNEVYTGGFFPDISYVLKIKGRGFMRYQIRMIMGALIQLGRGEHSIEEIKASLKTDAEITFNYVAPGSGLTLHRTHFKE
ncbi:MAG: tRNA pseudouridine(38-40) synthase TruA [Eudoraea sp.]|nr:tRNA pseudouridine(38-40) synthase TruA [Eudoraea sp.]